MRFSRNAYPAMPSSKIAVAVTKAEAKECVADTIYPVTMGAEMAASWPEPPTNAAERAHAFAWRDQRRHRPRYRRRGRQAAQRKADPEQCGRRRARARRPQDPQPETGADDQNGQPDPVRIPPAL